METIQYEGNNYIVPPTVATAIAGNAEHGFDQPLNIKVYDVEGNLISIPLTPEVCQQIRHKYCEHFI